MSQGFVTQNRGRVSSANSSTTPLTAAAVYTGTWEDISAYHSIIVAVKTDQDGTVQVQFSPDGTNADSTLTSYYHTGHIEAPHRYTTTRKYARVVFTNTSASNQTYFRLQTIVGDKAELNAPTDSVLAQHFDATVVRPTNFNYEVALGRRQGYTTWNKWGYNDDVDTGTETIWSYGGTFARMTATDTLSVVSSDVNDTSAGTGARSIVIIGVDENYVPQTVVVTMNGTTPVVTTGYNWLGVNRVAIYSAGTGEANAGNITVSRTTGGSVQAYVPLGEGATQQAFFFVPANHSILMDWMLLNVNKISGGGSPVVSIKGWVTSLVSNSKYEVFRSVIDTSVENTIEVKPSQPFVIGEKSLFELRATTNSDNTVVSARFSMIDATDPDAV